METAVMIVKRVLKVRMMRGSNNQIFPEHLQPTDSYYMSNVGLAQNQLEVFLTISLSHLLPIDNHLSGGRISGSNNQKAAEYEPS